MMRRGIWLLMALGAMAVAQDDDEEEIVIIIDEGEGADGKIRIEVDPFAEPDAPDEPNKPPPVRVGQWQPPELEGDARVELDALLARRAERPDDPGIRYRVAEFYLAHRWFPQAEAEFLACAKLDPESIRPWEGLVRVYKELPKWRDPNQWIQIVMAGGVVRLEPEEQDWLPSAADRARRATRAHREILARRPDDVARRRAFLEHLKSVRDHEAVLAEARGLLQRLPGDVDTRFDLADALRKIAERKEKVAAGSGAAMLAEAFELLEQNLAAHPEHAKSALRLSRMIAVRDGTKADDRITELEQRAVFHLFIRGDLAPVGYREDTFRMTRDLIGPRIANRLWDDALMPQWYKDLRNPPVRGFYRRWVRVHFPNAQPRDRMRVFARLQRRGDRDAAGILVAFLWRMQGPEVFPDTELTERSIRERLERAGVAATVGLGGAAYPAAERFLKAAETPTHRRRAMGILRGLEDPRAVRPLLDALAWDIDEKQTYGVAGVLEALGDAQAIDALVDAALDVRRPVARRREAAEALASFEDARSVEALSRLRKEKEFSLVTAYGLFRLTGDADAFATLKDALRGEEMPGEVVRLLRKWHDLRLEPLLWVGLTDAPRAVRPHIVGLLKERFWLTSKAKVKAALLHEAQSSSVTDFTLKELGEIGGEDVATVLLGLVKSLKGEQWAKAARALARTGDPRGVRYFSKTRILEKNPARRRLATDLLEEASARRAELERSKKPPRR